MRVFYINLTLSLLLLAGGFVCPPMVVIDGSVLTAVGLLLAFAVLARLPAFMEQAAKGKTIRLKKGDFTAEVSSSDTPSRARDPS